MHRKPDVEWISCKANDIHILLVLVALNMLIKSDTKQFQVFTLQLKVYMIKCLYSWEYFVYCISGNIGGDFILVILAVFENQPILNPVNLRYSQFIWPPKAILHLNIKYFVIMCS